MKLNIGKKLLILAMIIPTTACIWDERGRDHRDNDDHGRHERDNDRGDHRDRDDDRDHHDDDRGYHH